MGVMRSTFAGSSRVHKHCGLAHTTIQVAERFESYNITWLLFRPSFLPGGLGMKKSLLASVVILASTPCWCCPDGYYGGPFGTCLPNSGTVLNPTPQRPPVPIPPPPPQVPIPSFGGVAPPQPAAVLQTIAHGVQAEIGRASCRERVSGVV